MRFSRLISVVLLATVVLGLAEELPGPAAAVPTEKQKQPVAPKLAIDCPLPLRKLLRGGGGGGGHGGGGHMGGGGGHMGGGGGGFHSSGAVSHTGASMRSFSNPNPGSITHALPGPVVAQHHNPGPVVARNPNPDNHIHGGWDEHHHDGHKDHGNNQYYGGNPGGLWWFGGPTYVNNGGSYNSGVDEQQHCDPGFYYWCTPMGCECRPEDDDFLGRKLLAPSAAAAGTDGAAIENTVVSKTTAPELLPADPGRSGVLRMKPYRRRACKEGQPCRQATRSYRIKVHPAAA